MLIAPLNEEKQKTVLDGHNKDKKKLETIPLVLRNFHSGWPLIQVSLFSLEAGTMPMYGHVLGGGKCHLFYIGAFHLASIIAKITGNTKISGPKGEVRPEIFNLDNVNEFLDHFSFFHQKLGFTMISKADTHGKTLDIQIPVGDPSILREALFKMFAFALKQKKITDIGSWKDKSYSLQLIKESINEEVAIFHNGQIFIDLGAFLDLKIGDQELKDYFCRAFKVDDFIHLKNSSELKSIQFEGPENFEKSKEVPQSALSELISPHTLNPSDIGGKQRRGERTKKRLFFSEIVETIVSSDSGQLKKLKTEIEDKAEEDFGIKPAPTFL